MPTYTLAEMKKINRMFESEVFSGIDKHGKIKRPSCTWSPFECDCVYTKETQQQCPDFKEEE